MSDNVKLKTVWCYGTDTVVAVSTEAGRRGPKTEVKTGNVSTTSSYAYSVHRHNFFSFTSHKLLLNNPKPVRYEIISLGWTCFLLFPVFLFPKREWKICANYLWCKNHVIKSDKSNNQVVKQRKAQKARKMCAKALVFSPNSAGKCRKTRKNQLSQ
jgi:hypothetical protein